MPFGEIHFQSSSKIRANRAVSCEHRARWLPSREPRIRLSVNVPIHPTVCLVIGFPKRFRRGLPTWERPTVSVTNQSAYSQLSVLRIIIQVIPAREVALERVSWFA